MSFGFANACSCVFVCTFYVFAVSLCNPIAFKRTEPMGPAIERVGFYRISSKHIKTLGSANAFSVPLKICPESARIKSCSNSLNVCIYRQQYRYQWSNTIPLAWHEGEMLCSACVYRCKISTYILHCTHYIALISNWNYWFINLSIKNNLYMTMQHRNWFSGITHIFYFQLGYQHMCKMQIICYVHHTFFLQLQHSLIFLLRLLCCCNFAIVINGLVAWPFISTYLI